MVAHEMHSDNTTLTTRTGHAELPPVTAPLSPTLREWLGDRVSKLGRWADVLRERPVPVGWIQRWWWDAERAIWIVSGAGVRDIPVDQDLAMQYLNRRNDSFQMALFTRHPDVEPDPTEPPASRRVRAPGH